MRTSVTIFLGLVLQILPRFAQGLQPLSSQQKSSLSPFQKLGDRRAVLQEFAAGALGLGSAITLGRKPSFAVDDDVVNIPINPSFSVYQVKTDATASLEPSLNPLSKDGFLQQISSSQGGALWLGEHHNSKRDHTLQVELIQQLHAIAPDRPLAIGLEQVQRQFQPALDDYIAGKITTQQLRQQVQWDQRWVWPFEVYEPLIAMARDLNIPLIALNVNSEDLALVEKGGLPALPRDRLEQYITDAPGFAEFARPRQFSTYVDYVIRPSYDLHQDMGLLRYSLTGEKLEQDMTFRNFFSGRILWDEAMASAAYEWTRQNPGGLIVGLVGADHVKFRNGIPGRFSRMAATNNVDCISVILNPTLIDTRPSGSVSMIPGADSPDFPDQLTLQLRYLKDEVDPFSSARSLPESTGGVMSLADFLLIGR